jgi:membrane protein implicated in regulation of membrane protease activity
VLDIRIPIGLMFAILGPILIVFGLFSGPEIYEQHSLGVNVNFWWGFVLAAFGAFMLAMAYRASRKPGRQETP